MEGKGQGLRFGVILPHTNIYTDLIRSSILSRARVRGAKAVFFHGKNLITAPHSHFVNMVYQMVSEGLVNGLIVLPGGVESFVPYNELVNFCRRFAPLPVISIGGQVEGAAALLIDNESGLRKLMLHLIDEHGYRRLAFVTGAQQNIHARERYRIYQRVLAECGIPFDGDLVVSGRFTRDAGIAAVERLLQRRVAFDAVIASSDAIAWGVMDALHTHDIHIPNDVAVTGFDDILDSSYTLPSLTTVHQPLQEMGMRAVDMLLSMVAGNPSQDIEFETRLIVRESCGCAPPEIAVPPKSFPVEVRGTANCDLLSKRGQIQARLRDEIDALFSSENAYPRKSMLRCADALFNELETRQAGLFLDVFQTVLYQMARGDHLNLLYDILAAIEHQVLLHCPKESADIQTAESLWQQARNLLDQAFQQNHIRLRLQSKQQTYVLFEINEQIMTSFDIEQLKKLLTRSLQRLVIPRCYLCLRESPIEITSGNTSPSRSRLVFAYQDGSPLDLTPDGVLFSTNELLPREFLSDGLAENLLVMPLRIQNIYFGYIVFAIDSRDGVVYTTFQMQITNTVQGIFLARQITQAQGELENRVEERTAELQNAVARLKRRAIQLQVASEVAKDATSVRNLDELLNRVVNLARDRFEFYHVAVFLLDETGEYAVLTAASGETGRKMIRRGHKLKVGAEGIVGYVASMVQPHIALDVDADTVHYNQPMLPETRSELAVPLKVGEQVIGVLDIQSNRKNAFDKDDILVLQTMSDQLAVAINNIRLLEDVRQHADELKSLYNASLAISRELEMDALLHRLYEQIQQLIAPDIFIVTLYDEKQDNIHAVLAIENGKSIQAFQGMRVPTRDGGFTGHIIQTGKSLLLNDIENDELPIPPIRDPDEEIPTLSWLGVPLIARDKILGVVSVQSHRKGAFGYDHQRFLESLAAQIAIAFDNARLFEAERNSREQAETLSEIARVINGSLDLSEVLNHIIEQIRRVLLFDTASVALMNEKQNTLLVALLGYDEKIQVQQSSGELLKDSKILMEMTETLQPVRIPDVRNYPAWIWIPGAEHIRSFLGVPIIDQGKMIGALMLDRIQVNAFTDEEVQMVQSVVPHIAIAIKNAHLFQQVVTERQRISTLYDLSRAIAASLQPETILQTALNLTCKAIGGEMGIAWLYLPEEKKLLASAFSDQKSWLDFSRIETPDIQIAAGDGPIGRIVHHKEPINLASVPDIRRWLPVSQAPLQAMLAAPLLEGETLLGVITIFHSETAAFDGGHLDLLQTICQQVGLALSNAHRYQDINRLANLLSVERSRLEGLLEMLPVGVLLLDARFNLLVINPLGREFLKDLAPQTTEDQPVLKLGQYEISRLLEHHTDPLPLEIKINSPARRIFESQAQLIPADPLQWVVTLRDVTQEREIQDRVQMQERLATVGQLAAGIAHDFNNIMAAIVVYADLLLMEKNLSATSRERLVIIQQQVQRAASLIRQILDFSRRSVMEHNVFDLLPFLKEMEKLLRRTLPETITVRLRHQGGEYTILADPTRLQQVFMNLAVNARDAMPDGGEICFDLARITLEPGAVPPIPEMQPGHWVHLRVSDTGKGIPPEAQPHIFEPFFTTKPVGKGTGLGLAQVYGIIKQHKGFIDFESQPGQGTLFNIYLPDIASTPTEMLPASAAVEMDGSGKTVLLVEDDEATRNALEAMLTAHRYHVLAAKNGLEAISVLEQEPVAIDLVVSDIVMPQMGGLELYDQMQARWPQAQILFITGHPLDEQNQQLLQRGQIHWLQKPFTVQEFNQVVLELMEEKPR